MNKNPLQKKEKRHRLTEAITVALIVTVALSVITSAAVFAQTKEDTIASIQVAPKTVKMNESIVITAWVSPVPPYKQPGNLPGEYVGYTFTITKPNGDTENVGPVNSKGDGTYTFNYICNQLGEWSAKMSFPGDETHKECATENMYWTVNEEGMSPEVFGSPFDPNSNSFSRPIASDQRQLSAYAGPWLQSRYDGFSNFNPYSKAPSTNHTLWTRQVSISGLIGGEYGNLSFPLRGGFSGSLVPPVAIAGRLYYTNAITEANSNGTVTVHPRLYCLDESTGEEIFVSDLPAGGAGGTLQIELDPLEGTARKGQEGAVFRIWASGGGLWEINPWTGAAINYWPKGSGGVFYNNSFYSSTGGGKIQRWDTLSSSARTTGNWSENIMWTTQPVLGSPAQVVDGVLCTITNNGGAAGIDATTGEILWNKTLDEGALIYSGAGSAADVFAFGKIICPCEDRVIRAWDVKTGNLVWTSDFTTDYPFGSFWAYNSGAAYGMVYLGCYDGHMYCIDADTGSKVWDYYSGDTMETMMGTHAFWGAPVIADGKVYVATGQHSPPQPLPRGDKLYCLDAYDGTLIWTQDDFLSVSTPSSGGLVVDGMLFYTNLADGQLYCFGKGSTLTEVKISDAAITKGSAAVIEGTVLDQSLKSPNAPCAGVQVKLVATNANGEPTDLGTVKTDAKGHFSYMWTPQNPDLYTVSALFEGNDAYWSSSDETALGVTSSSANAQPIESPAISANPVQPPAESPSTSVYIVVTVAVIISAIALAALTLWKKQRKP
jgi:outer membrane protein assembly factor BamB